MSDEISIKEVKLGLEEPTTFFKGATGSKVKTHLKRMLVLFVKGFIFKVLMQLIKRRNLSFSLREAINMGLTPAIGNFIYKLVLWLSKNILGNEKLQERHYFTAAALSSLTFPAFIKPADRSVFLAIVQPTAISIIIKEMQARHLLPQISEGPLYTYIFQIVISWLFFQFWTESYNMPAPYLASVKYWYNEKNPEFQLRWT